MTTPEVSLELPGSWTLQPTDDPGVRLYVRDDDRMAVTIAAGELPEGTSFEGLAASRLEGERQMSALMSLSEPAFRDEGDMRVAEYRGLDPMKGRCIESVSYLHGARLVQLYLESYLPEGPSAGYFTEILGSVRFL